MDRDEYGWMLAREERMRIAEMMFPVRCAHCRRVYDMSRVEVTARYVDCSVWKAPCCGRTVDDRPAGWGIKDYEEFQ